MIKKGIKNYSVRLRIGFNCVYGNMNLRRYPRSAYKVSLNLEVRF